MSANSDCITVETYIPTGKQLKTSCGANVKKFIFWAIWGALGSNYSDSQWLDWAYLALQVSSRPYLCTCEIRKKSDKNFQIQNMKKKTYLGVLGGPALTWNPRLPNLQGARSYHRADKCITREKNNQVVHIGPQCDLFLHFWLFGVGVGSDWAHLAFQLSSYPYQSTYKIWKQSSISLFSRDK